MSTSKAVLLTIASFILTAVIVGAIDGDVPAIVIILICFFIAAVMAALFSGSKNSGSAFTNRSVSQTRFVPNQANNNAIKGIEAIPSNSAETQAESKAEERQNKILTSIVIILSVIAMGLAICLLVITQNQGSEIWAQEKPVATPISTPKRTTTSSYSYSNRNSTTPTCPPVNREQAMSKEEAERLSGTGYHGTRPNSSAENTELRAAQTKCKNCGYRTHNGANSLCDYCAWMQRYGGGLPSTTASTSKPTSTPRPTATPNPMENDDPYNAKGYSDPDDFYYDHYDDFWEYEDAEDYWNQHNLITDWH